MGLKVAKELSEKSMEYFGKKEITIGWVATRHYLLEQAAEENQMVGCPNVKFISMFDSNPPAVDMLILDEARHEACASGADLFSKINPKLVLGLDATPYRGDRVKLCFNKRISDAGIRQLIRQGYLTKFNSYMMTKYTVENVVKTYLADKEKWGKTVIYFLTIAECEDAAARLRDNGIRVEVVTGNSDRETQIAAFKAGKLDVLVNVFVLSEGFNCDALQTVFVRDSSKGPTIQMAGRCLRLHKDKQRANVVQSIETKYPFQRYADAEFQFKQNEDGEWEAIGKTEAVKRTSEIMIKRVMNTKVTMPHFLSKNRAKSVWPPKRNSEEVA